jgi:putative transcriptional regulator
VPGPGSARGLPRCVRRHASLAVALLAAAGAAPESPPPRLEVEPPATGRFLVASEQVRGSFFEHSVVFLLSYNESAALGLIVNRPTEVELHDIVQGAIEGAGALYLGGPVGTRSVMVLLRTGSPPEHAIRVIGDVFMTVDPAILLEHTGKTGSIGDLRVYAGYAGWGPGQLDAEIARGDWIVVREAVDAIFDAAPEALWKKLHLRHHRILTRAPGPQVAIR